MVNLKRTNRHKSCERSITLIRHGPPAVSLRQRVGGHQFRQFVERYDAARIAQRSLPPLAVRQVMANADVVFASHRPRATHTAELLDVPVPPVVDSQFREIEFPVDFPRQLRFSALTWSVIAIALWRLGYTARSESLARTRKRAKIAADTLESQLAYPLDDISSVVLVAHAGINRLIAKELRRRGWRGRKRPHSRHWGCTTYCR
ncbi:MAG: histidine phosphatase family protein [Cyanobacteria bacterium P01_D01_bin.105]